MATAKTPKAPTAAPAPAKAVAAPVAKSAGAAAVPVNETPAAAIEPAAVVETVTAPVDVPVTAIAPPEPAPAPAAAKPVELTVASVSIVVEPVLQGVDELIDFGKANAEAVVAAGHSLALGLHHLAQDLIEWSQESLESTVETSKALASAASVQDVIELSRSAAKHSLDKMLDEGSKIGSLSTKLVEESFAPLRSRVVAVVEKLTHHAA